MREGDDRGRGFLLGPLMMKGPANRSDDSPTPYEPSEN